MSNDSQNELVELAILFILSAICGEGCSRAGLPRLSGHIIAGFLFGTKALLFNVVSPASLYSPLAGALKDVCIAVLGTAAGSELKVSLIMPRLREVSITVGTHMVVTGLLTSLCAYGWILYLVDCQATPEMPFKCRSVAALMGTLLLTRSPACVIGVIRDTRAAGPLSSLTLGTALALDACVVAVFSFVATCAAVGQPMHAVSVALIRIGFSFGVAAVIAAAIKAVRHLPATPGVRPSAIIALQLIPFIIARGFHSEYGIDALLTVIAAAAAAAHQAPNLLHAHGMTFMKYALVALFSMAGSRVNVLSILTGKFPVIVSLVLLRMIGFYISTNVAARLTTTSPGHIRPYRWMCLITQGGVTLALLNEALEVVGDVPFLADVMLPIIAVHMILGPAMFKYSILRVGENNRQTEDEDGNGGDGDTPKGDDSVGGRQSSSAPSHPQTPDLPPLVPQVSVTTLNV
eukprot:PhM_4_TR3178/c0_g1_i1/m.12071